MSKHSIAETSGRAILEFLSDRVSHVTGPTETRVLFVAPFEPGADSALSFLTAANVQQLSRVASRSTVVLIPTDASAPLRESKSLWIGVDDPRLEFARVLSWLLASSEQRSDQGLVAGGTLLQSGVLDVDIAPTAMVAPDVVIGPGTKIGPNAVLFAGTSIGRDTVVGANCVIGGTGFGFVRDRGGAWLRVPHLGGVNIGSNVELGACAHVDRGTLADTFIDDGTKIDNGVQVGHNSYVGKHVIVGANAVLCGGAVVGEGAWIAPNSTIREHIHVDKGAVVGLGAVVLANVGAGQSVLGNPARPLPAR